MSTEKIHEQKETLSVDINVPGHAARVTTALFTRSKKVLMDRVDGRCYICGRNEKESGHPLEAHHHPIERSMAEMIDWDLFRKSYPTDFDWSKFDPADPYSFVDDMTVNGLILCKDHHTGKDEGIHDMPFPLWIAQRFGKEGYEFSSVEVIHHHQP